MKPIVKESDYRTIKNIINNLSPSQKTREVGQLMDELNLAKKVPDTKIAKNIIQLNSYFEVELGQPSQTIKMKMVIPKDANLAENKISVFSPLSVALIGFREGASVDWVLPGGLRKIKILKVTNQDQKELVTK
ncbi:GreA/GreB family elongation factor [Cyclobacterium marinum]|uniref:GreA/GreB family elongation factor n=1 Tax=Cyclobacterium marinum (strain ATCC 25205 / DSM 745 / LMG 13164 / NCIMB 1802) TaxID=880070 RepID=G0J408_CYCMS|nr:GreA/GreB family elongation factor [Cyclobacterium marinum]AEL26674.1 GreA/GreB family elongation factor [Cyclobacterium marinum DSM 745]MBI0400025.1 GreA/GreB family elongation factor [Cyclobacterium marinum]MBR9776136.1 transcription elongation factor GreAB [Cytophagales bacterium]|tara:strand:+ start:54756 stop:55154 length:399 start_codon:yes stop_codon:yes gene_type:complete